MEIRIDHAANHYHCEKQRRYFSIMGKKEKRHKHSHTSKKKKKKKKNKLDTSKSRSRLKSRPRPKARPASSDSFSTSDTSTTSSSDYEHQQSRHHKQHGTKHSRSDSSPDRGHIKKNKRRKRFETTTTDSESEVRVGLDTEVDTVVDSDNEPIPNLCHIEVEIESKTSSSNTVNLKLPGSTAKKKMKKRNNKDDQRESSKTLSELWPKSNKYYEKINTEIKESNSASLSKSILIDFKAKKFPFILSTNVFQEFLSDLESTVGNKLNLRDFNFSYRYPVLGKDCDITINSQVTFTAFIKYILSDNPDLILIKITRVNSQPLLLLKKDELSPPKSDDETMQPQSESPLENQLDFKNASRKEILKYLDQFEWKPEHFKEI